MKRMLSRLACALLAIGSTTLLAGEPHVSLGLEGDQYRFEVRDLPEELVATAREQRLAPDDWQKLFSVHVARASRGVPPLIGKYELDGTVLRFTPRFQLRAGQTYEARLKLGAWTSTAASPVVQRFELKERPPAGEPAELVAVYPTRSVLPENQLKFYLHFSQPMSRGEAYRHIRLLDRNQQPVEYPFLELTEELWDPQLLRFTLFFDPGRIKKGLKPREQFGPPIVEGGSYTLVIETTWLDANRQPLKERVTKSFEVVAADETQPDPQRWQLNVPTAGESAPFSIQFDEPLDHAMLHRVIHVEDASGAIVAGRVETSQEETVWKFVPDREWAAGKFHVVIDARLEDLAGNSIARPFEVDLIEPGDNEPVSSVKLPFEVKEKSVAAANGAE